MKFDRKLTFEDHVRGIVSRVSQRIGILRFVKLVFLDSSSLLLCISFPILEYCSPVWGSAAECHLQLLERQVYSVAWLCPVQIFLSSCHRRHVAALCMLYTVNSNSNPFLFSELPSASVRIRHSLAAGAAHPFEFEVSRCMNFEEFEVSICKVFPAGPHSSVNDLPYTVFDTGGRIIKSIYNLVSHCLPCSSSHNVVNHTIGIMEAFSNGNIVEKLLAKLQEVDCSCRCTYNGVSGVIM